MQKNLHIHFIGIGGIGMSGIAKILKIRGYQVSGCDVNIHQKSILELTALGCSIFPEHNSAHCTQLAIDLVVYSSDINPAEPELTMARNLGITTIQRGLLLAQLMRNYLSIAITGSHGKTTTTALVSELLLHAHMDPTIVVGGYLKSINTNAHQGTSRFFVVEADESDRSHLFMNPEYALITNMDLDHVDTYASLNDIKTSFEQFLSNVPFYGTIFLCADDPYSLDIAPRSRPNIVWYGTCQRAAVRAVDIELNPTTSSFTLLINNAIIGSMTINTPGIHNVRNALGAIAIAHTLAIDTAVIQQALAKFSGVERRFCYHGMYKGALLYDDYGHHHEEIKSILPVAQSNAKGGVIVIFQPHRYSRTAAFWQEFIHIFASSTIKHLIVTDIYGKSEDPIENISGYELALAIRATKPSFGVSYSSLSNGPQDIKNALDAVISENDLILLQGAGNLAALSIPFLINNQ